MKRAIWPLAAASLFLFAHADAQRRPKRPTIKPVPTKIDVTKIKLAPVATAAKKAAFAKRIQKAKQRSRRAGAQAPPPRPLPRAERRAAIAQIRSIARTDGIALMNAVAKIPDPPTSFVLTPDKPRVGQSSLTLIAGSSAAAGFSAAEPAPAYKFREYGYVQAHFSPLEVGGVYLLDCTVANNLVRVWQIHGPTQASLKAQNGHLLIGFIATETKVTVGIFPDKPFNNTFYGCELTRAG